MKIPGNKVLGTILLLVMVILAGCSEDDIEIVKKGHLEFNKSVAIGQALDGYKFFAKKEWQPIKSQNGARMVIFKADMTPQYVKEINEACKADPHHKKVERQKWAIQFTVNKDNTAHISGTQTLNILADKAGKKVGNLSELLMQSVFKNELALVCGKP